VIPADGHSLTGRVELPEPQAWFWLSLAQPDQPAVSVVATMSDAQGGFTFHGIPPGSYDILVAQGVGTRGQRSSRPSSGARLFARVHVDVSDRDVSNIMIVPKQGGRALITLRQANAVPCGRLLDVVFTPIEDWADFLERVEAVTAGKDQSAPQDTIYGLAPGKYAASVQTNGGCRIEGDPILDVGNSSGMDHLEANVTAPGALRGTLNTGGQSPKTWEVILLPADFAQGWPFLGAGWFSLRNGALGRGTVALYRPHVRISFPDSEAGFTFGPSAEFVGNLMHFRAAQLSFGPSSVVAPTVLSGPADERRTSI
jgi:hypothetical protein